MKRLLGYGSLVAGYVLISLPLYAQGLFPIINPDGNKWWILAVSIVFTVVWFLITRRISIQDETDKQTRAILVDLKENVKDLNYEHRQTREMLKHMAEKIIPLEKQVSRHNHWINGHAITHAKCPSCPDDDNHTKLTKDE
jgi:hypothetical protein